VIESMTIELQQERQSSAEQQCECERLRASVVLEPPLIFDEDQIRAPRTLEAVTRKSKLRCPGPQPARGKKPKSAGVMSDTRLLDLLAVDKDGAGGAQ
jgi:hypothetical protein